MTDATVQSIEVSPPSPTVSVGFTVHLTATATFSDGRTGDVTEDVTWSSSDAAVASVSNAAASKGLVTALAPGSVQITAHSGTIEGSTSVTSSDAGLVSIHVTPTDPDLAAGHTQHLIATATFEDGRTSDVTDLVTWSSSAPGIVSVSNADGSRGLVTAVSPGTAEGHRARRSGSRGRRT